VFAYEQVQWCINVYSTVSMLYMTVHFVSSQTSVHAVRLEIIFIFGHRLHRAFECGGYLFEGIVFAVNYGKTSKLHTTKLFTMLHKYLSLGNEIKQVNMYNIY